MSAKKSSSPPQKSVKSAKSAISAKGATSPDVSSASKLPELPHALNMPLHLPPDTHLSGAFTRRIVYAMLLGLLVGFVLTQVPLSAERLKWLDHHVFSLIGEMFIRLLRMLVVPIVFVSLVSGVASLGSPAQLGRVGLKSLVLYLSTTALAITFALFFAKLFSIGAGLHLGHAKYQVPDAPSWRDILLHTVPQNPVHALSQGNMLQIIFFSILLGLGLTALREIKTPAIRAAAHHMEYMFQSLSLLFMKLMTMVIKLAPYGVFFLLATLVMRQGLEILLSLMGYFMLVLFVLFLQSSVTYTVFLSLCRLNPWTFFSKLIPALLFAFSVSSSNASIPVVLRTVQRRLGVAPAIASFVIPLGATVNMDGTAIMQGVATIFIANAYHVHLAMSGYLTVIAMATLASVGTAGVPGVGLMTLAMVLTQLQLPVQGIALIMGVDRLLDMARTMVNVSGDAMVACVVAKTEGMLDRSGYKK